jgi:hypothetical protein
MNGTLESPCRMSRAPKGQTGRLTGETLRQKDRAEGMAFLAMLLFCRQSQII